MKKFILLFLCLFLFSINLYAEEESASKNWTFRSITRNLDQDPKPRVSLFYNVQDSDLVGFCMEPDIVFNSTYNYVKQDIDSKRLYDIARAFSELEYSDDLLIAAQMMVWKETTDIDFTYHGNDADYYGRQLIENKINENNELYQKILDVYVDGYSNQSNTIDNLDLAGFELDSLVGIDDIQINETSITYSFDDVLPVQKQIILKQTGSYTDKEYVIHSEEGQDLFVYNKDSSNYQTMNIYINTLDDDLSISYKKLDRNNNPIEGAEFTIYEINGTDSEIYFLNTNTQVDLLSSILTDADNYDINSLSIKVSERYSSYLNDSYIYTDEIGYFPFEIYNNEQLIKSGRVYVSNDANQTNGSFNKVSVDIIKTDISKNTEINTVNGLKPNKKYYLCESEPMKGYRYSGNACVLIDTSDNSYLNINTFINDNRTYNLHLTKDNPDHTINLNGARFKMSFSDDNNTYEYEFVTGALNIKREGNKEYLIYKKENTNDIKVDRYESDTYINSNVTPGKYYYYQSDNDEIDENLLNDRYIKVIEGGYEINDLPYNSMLRLEELEAPKGYYIEEAVFYLNADIPYSEITFKNDRVNSFEILPARKMRIPKTCIGS